LVRVWQGLDRLPQLIDQRLAVANFSPFLDTGQSIPQRQQPLATEQGDVQFLLRFVTVISPSLTVAGASRQSVIPSLPMI
jgi:hypothetical protein